LPAGTDTVTATYGGSANFSGSTGSISQTVNWQRGFGVAPGRLERASDCWNCARARSPSPSAGRGTRPQPHPQPPGKAPSRRTPAPSSTS